MQKLNPLNQLATAALIGIIALHIMMILALFAQIEPHPPAIVGPLIGATIACAAFTLILIRAQHRSRHIALIVSILLALPSVGPHKFLTEQNALTLSPVILSGTTFLIILIVYTVRDFRKA